MKAVFLLFLLLMTGNARSEVTEISDLVNPFPAGFTSPPDQPYGWSLLPPGRPFPSLPSDPRDLKLALRKNSRKEIEADVGGYRSIGGWKGPIFGEDLVAHIGIEGNGYFVLHQEGSRFPLHSSDGLIGLYAEGIQGLWLYQARYTHISAHLSDGLYLMRNRISYTRETLSLRVARQLGVFRPYIGYHYLVHTEPKFPPHSLQVGFYSILPWHVGRIHPYFGMDFRWRNHHEGTSFTYTHGLAFVSSLGAPPLRLSFNYLKGHDLRGQFYMEETEHYSIGLDMDF